MMNLKAVNRLNPSTVSAPVGNYSHVTFIPKDANLYAFSGQIGTDSNGQIPDNFNKQVFNTLENIKLLLASQNLNSKDVIKVNIWATKEIDWDYFDRLWNLLFFDGNPSMTIAYVYALGLPEIHVEIEIWAAK
ncbi:RidA family protein [Sphingobacterium nematocida]|nr:RidA family protein [Sphingobacterium nematocida]